MNQNLKPFLLHVRSWRADVALRHQRCQQLYNSSSSLKVERAAPLHFFIMHEDQESMIRVITFT